MEEATTDTEGLIQMTDYYTPSAPPNTHFGYQPGYTYMIGGYRMYLQSGYWYYVDYPYEPPLRASRPHYRTGGVPGIFLKWFGVIAFIAGIGMMFGEGPEFIVPGAFLLAFGIFGTVLAIADSMRNHSAAWKVGATAAVVGYALHSLTDNDR